MHGNSQHICCNHVDVFKTCSQNFAGTKQAFQVSNDGSRTNKNNYTRKFTHPNNIWKTCVFFVPLSGLKPGLKPFSQVGVKGPFDPCTRLAGEWNDVDGRPMDVHEAVGTNQVDDDFKMSPSHVCLCSAFVWSVGKPCWQSMFVRQKT